MVSGSHTSWGRAHQKWQICTAYFLTLRIRPTSKEIGTRLHIVKLILWESSRELLSNASGRCDAGLEAGILIWSEYNPTLQTVYYRLGKETNNDSQHGTARLIYSRFKTPQERYCQLEEIMGVRSNRRWVNGNMRRIQLPQHMST